MATELREMLTDCDLSRMRIALEERIVSLLRSYREWTPEILATLKSYGKVGGYWTQERYEEFAKVKIGDGK